MPQPTPTKIISKLSPPTSECHLFFTLQTRDGRTIEYESGPSVTDQQRYEECGGCAFCIGQVGFSNPKREKGYYVSHPTFRRFIQSPCETCKPKVNRLNEIDALINALHTEAMQINAAIY